MKDTKTWLTELRDQYDLEATQAPSDSQFLDHYVNLRTRDGSGIAIRLAFNNQGEISMLDTEQYQFHRLNIAEGFTQPDLRTATEKLLSNDFEAKKTIFGRRYIELKLGKLSVIAKQPRRMRQ